jgi:dTDP-glucose 4,6-dehydratase
LYNYPLDDIFGVDFLFYVSNLRALNVFEKHQNLTFYNYNICDRDSMERVFSVERPDVVINFAAESHVDRSIENSSAFLQTNVLGTAILLDMSVKYGVKRFHQVSTDEVYGGVSLDAQELFTEESALNPSSPYSASKAAADLLTLSYMKTHGLPVSISRSSNNYGKYQHSEKLIPMAIERLLSDNPVPLYGDGKNVRDWLFVLDNCRAIDLIIREGECGIYNVSVCESVSNIDLVRKIMTYLGKPEEMIEFVEDRKGHDRKYAINCSKIKSLGWMPEAKFDVELKNTVQWYKCI